MESPPADPAAAGLEPVLQPGDTPAGFRSGFVALIGRPNVGKSTLLNQLVGSKVAITSPIAQTTRHRLRAILTTASAQLVLLDTPGIHKPQHLLGQLLVQSARGAIGEVDLVLLLVDGSQPAGRGDGFIIELLHRSGMPVQVALNKADLVDPIRAEQLAASYVAMIAEIGARLSRPAMAASAAARTAGESPAAASSTPAPAPAPAGSVAAAAAAAADATAADAAGSPDLGDPGGRACPWPLHRVSALHGEGCSGLVQALCAALPLGPHLYPPDAISDQPEQLLLAELIREQVLRHTREEVPHSVAVQIDRIVADGPRTAVLATVLVERPSQKGILIGRGGSMLRNIGQGARLQMQKLIAGPVYLELFVKVVPGWRSHPARLAELGYRGD